ncbi:MAG: ATP-binding protein [Legionella sp.]
MSLLRKKVNISLDLNAHYFKIILDHYSCLPGSIYWKDLNGIYIWCNQAFLESIGVSQSIIGKSDIDLWPQYSAQLLEHDQTVLVAEKVGYFEEVLGVGNHKKHFLAIKSLLRNATGNKVGIVTILIDLHQIEKISSFAADGKVSKLELVAALKLQTQRARIAEQVFHDINSPLTTLKILEAHLSRLPELSHSPTEKRIPEMFRTSLRNSIRRIADTINNLYRDSHYSEVDVNYIYENKSEVLLSAVLYELLSQKHLEYEDVAVQFITEFNQTSYFSFIHVQCSSLMRAISNLINNAAQSIEGKVGTVTIALDSDDSYVYVAVKDNGKGMSAAMLEMIMSQVSFTADKPKGRGIGLGQVQDTLLRNGGKMNIVSQVGDGTHVTLSFPKQPAPAWCIETIEIHRGDIIIILDDDPSAHSAWELRFKDILVQDSTIDIYHFQACEEAMNYILSLSKEDKNKLLLLTDFEFLNQSLNGLEVIQAADLKRAILVTSHYLEPETQWKITTLAAKLLPKQLVSEIPLIYKSLR